MGRHSTLFQEIVDDVCTVPVSPVAAATAGATPVARTRLLLLQARLVALQLHPAAARRVERAPHEDEHAQQHDPAEHHDT